MEQSTEPFQTYNQESVIVCTKGILLEQSTDSAVGIDILHYDSILNITKKEEEQSMAIISVLVGTPVPIIIRFDSAEDLVSTYEDIKSRVQSYLNMNEAGFGFVSC
jgi:hypothetical protein